MEHQKRHLFRRKPFGPKKDTGKFGPPRDNEDSRQLFNIFLFCTDGAKSSTSTIRTTTQQPRTTAAIPPYCAIYLRSITAKQWLPSVKTFSILYPPTRGLNFSMLRLRCSR
eukprot:scaffold7387_cov145-Skeletonema_menzelii.AAC.7